MNKEDILKEIKLINEQLEQLELIIAQDIGSCMISSGNDAIHEQMKLDQRLYVLEKMLKEF